MKQHTSDFKNEMKKMGRKLYDEITYTKNNEQIVLHNELYRVNPHYEANLLKSVMKELEIESSVEIEKDTIVNYRMGLLVNGEYEYIDYGNYIVYNVEKIEDSDKYKITCYDKMLYFMKNYENMNITYPISLRDYINRLVQFNGLTFANRSSTFANYNRMIQSELYLDSQGNDIGYTFRDVLDEIAQATGSIVCINSNDEVEIRYITNTNDYIDENYLKDVNVKFGEKYGPVNSIVLSRSGESDNVYTNNPQSIEENGLTEIKIVDNQLMNWNDRADYLNDLASVLMNLEYYINDFSSTGILYYELGDRYSVYIGENSYSCVMLNDEVERKDGLQELIHTDMPEETETDYTKADKDDRKINKTYLLVDKQNQIIQGVVSQVGEQNEQIAQIRLDYNELISKISDIADITTSGESSYATVNLVEVNTSQPIDIKIHPISESINYLHPLNSLYPSDTLYFRNRILRFANTDTNENFDWELPTNLWYYNSEIYDELELSYGNGDNSTVIVTRRCQIDSSGVITPLATEVTETYQYPTELVLSDGDYTISLVGYSTAYLYVQLMAKNIYTTQFYTKAETNSIINQTASSIDLSVNQKLTNYSTTSEMNSAINVKAGEITSTVSSTYETKTSATQKYSQLQQTDSQISSTVATKVGNNEIISKINQSAEAVTINANKISLSGKTINLTSDNMAINSTNFKVDKNGNLTCSNANITDGKVWITGGTESNPNMKVYDNNNEVEVVPYGMFVRSADGGFYINNSANSQSKAYLYADSTGGGITIGGQSSADISIRGGYDSYIRCNGNMYADAYNYISLEEKKKNITKYEKEAISIIMDSDLYEFNYKEEDNNYKKHIGFVIGDKYKTPKEVISQKGDSINSYSMNSIMWKAIQEQQEQIEILKKEIEKLKGGK